MFGMNYLRNRLLSTRVYFQVYQVGGSSRRVVTATNSTNETTTIRNQTNLICIQTNSQSWESRKNQNKFDKNTYRIDRTEETQLQLPFVSYLYI